MTLTLLLQRPIAILTSVVGLLVLGFVVVRSLPISSLPETAIPKISVQVNAPNVAAQALENTVVRPLRNQLLQVNQLKDIQSQTQDGSATIELDFEYGTNVDLTYIEVNEKIDQISNLLPRELERPQVLKASVTDIPVFYLSVVPKRENNLELATFVRSVLKRRIEQLPQVAFVDVSGYAAAELGIYPNWRLMQSLNLQEENLKRILQSNNLNLGSVLIQDGQYQYNIRFLSEVRTKEDVENIYFRHEGQVLQLKDIAAVRLQKKAARGSYLFNGREAIVLAVRKQADAQLFALKKEFETLLTAFENDYPDLEFQVSNDQSELLAVSIDNLRTSLLYGACFAIVVMFLFFRSWKAPLLIAVAIPVSLMITLLLFYFFEISINIISLSGLILGVGLMIDNAIIVIENVQQYRQMGYERTAACAKGTNEVIRPLLSSALTTCSVFLPLIFLSGLAGTLFYDQAVSITIALFASLLVAYILLPTLFRLLLKKEKTEQQAQPSYITVSNFYTRSVDIVLRYRWIFLLVFIGLVGVIYFPFQQLSQETFPPLTRKALSLEIDWNESLALEENERRVRQVLKNLESNFDFSTTFVGEQQFLLENESGKGNQANILLFLDQIEDEFIPKIQTYFAQQFPYTQLKIEPLKNIFDQIFSSQTAPLIIHLQKNNTAELPNPSEVQTVVDFYQQQGIATNIPLLKEQYEIAILREKVLLYNLSYEAVFQKLQSLFDTYELGTLKTSSDYIPIAVATQSTALYERMTNAQIYNTKGQEFPLQQFVEVKKTQAYQQIYAGKTGVNIPLAIPVFQENLIKESKNYLRENTNLSASFSGQVFEDQQNVRELSVILGISLLLLYLILAAQFESLLQPFIVMLTVPIGLAGAVATLWFFNQSINLISIIGMIVMSGIVVNDAILKVDMMNRLRKKYDLITAIHGAGIRRLKPILMTSITTILALMPILFASGLGAELQRPLAYAVIGGLVVGTISSLYFIPLIYKTFHK
ncbi:MAG: efflux RND transporter permease subunit [Bacteroidota bacterium]